MTEAEVGVMWPQVKEGGQPLEVTEGKEWILPQVSRRNSALLTS